MAEQTQAKKSVSKGAKTFIILSIVAVAIIVPTFIVLSNPEILNTQQPNQSGVPVPSSPPTNLVGQLDGTEVTLSWKAPVGVTGLTGYSIYNGGILIKKVSNLQLSTTLLVTPGITYNFKVRSANAGGESISFSNVVVIIVPESPSAPSPAPQKTLPAPPASLTGSYDATSKVLTLSWTAPANDGGSPITGYKIYLNNAYIGSYTQSPVQITMNPMPSASVTYTVRSVNDIGESIGASNGYTFIPPTASPSPTPQATFPGAPTGLTGSYLNGYLTLSWVAPPNNGGSAITGYNLYKDGKLFGTITGVMISIAYASVPETAITYKLKAVNAIGESIAFSNEYVFGGSTTPSAPVPQLNAPAAPTMTGISVVKTPLYDYPPEGGKVLVGYAIKIKLTWNAPSSDGGSAITGYKIYTGTNALVATLGNLLTTEIKVSPSVSGTTYTYKMRAVNAVGESITFSNALSITLDSEGLIVL